MKYYVIIDTAAKHCPYMGGYLQKGSNQFWPVAVSSIKQAKIWEVINRGIRDFIV